MKNYKSICVLEDKTLNLGQVQNFYVYIGRGFFEVEVLILDGITMTNKGEVTDIKIGTLEPAVDRAAFTLDHVIDVAFDVARIGIPTSVPSMF